MDHNPSVNQTTTLKELSAHLPLTRQVRLGFFSFAHETNLSNSGVSTEASFTSLKFSGISK